MNKQIEKMFGSNPMFQRAKQMAQVMILFQSIVCKTNTIKSISLNMRTSSQQKKEK
jgi:hypothetical protein